jgi:hypothetical protein
VVGKWDEKLTQPARKAIADSANTLTISVATILGTVDQDNEAPESIDIKRHGWMSIWQNACQHMGLMSSLFCMLMR